MASFSPTITTNTTPAITNSLSGSTTYTQFKNSLGQYDYFVKQIYLNTNNLVQIQGSFLYSKYDSDGKQNLQSVLSTISPYQRQKSIYINTEDKNLILDGRDFVRFKMQPNTSLQIKLYCDRVSNADTLDLNGMNNFKALENASDKYDFFDQYVDIL
tara:strand:+ start:13475 stop:13945 length:471 start_codon:yes stop_codon:yes gene_type:complete